MQRQLEQQRPPEDMLTRQPVDLLKSTDEQLIPTDKDTGEVDDPDDITVTKGETEDAKATVKPTITKADTKEVAQRLETRLLQIQI